jgi:uncharacterized protein YjcR
MIRNEEMKALCIAGEMSNKELADYFEVSLTAIHAWRSSHGLTIPKCEAIRAGGVKVGKRAPKEIEAEIGKVRKAMNDAQKKAKRAVERLAVLEKELKEAEG